MYYIWTWKQFKSSNPKNITLNQISLYGPLVCDVLGTRQVGIVTIYDPDSRVIKTFPIEQSTVSVVIIYPNKTSIMFLSAWL